MIYQLDTGFLVNKREGLEKRNEHQSVWNQVSEKYAGRQRCRSPKFHRASENAARTLMTIVSDTTHIDTTAEFRKNIRYIGSVKSAT